MGRRHERKTFKDQVEAQAEAKDVAGKAIGRHGMFFITLIVVIGVGASVFLEEAKIAAVIGLLSAALTGLIAMLSGIAEAEKGEGERPEMDIVRRLIDKIDRDPLVVDVNGDRVMVTKGSDTINAKLGKAREQEELKEDGGGEG